MCLRSLEIFYFFPCGDRLYTPESDVYRRQILTYKDGPRTERVKWSEPLKKEVINLGWIKILKGETSLINIRSKTWYYKHNNNSNNNNYTMYIYKINMYGKIQVIYVP